MNEKGFTLIELLAVIVIIGLLSVLIIPKVNSTIKDSRKNAGELSAKALAREADSYYLTQRGKGIDFAGCVYNFDTNSNTCEGFAFTGERPTYGKVVIREGGAVGLAVKFGDYCYIKGFTSDNVTVLDFGESTCNI